MGESSAPGPCKGWPGGGSWECSEGQGGEEWGRGAPWV